MLKLKVKTIGYDEDSQLIKVENYKAKNTNTLEHICAIGVLVNSIMNNDEDMTISELCKLIRENYKQHLIEMESEN